MGFSFTDVKDKGLWFPRVEACCQYKKPARFNDQLEVELIVEELNEKAVKFAFRVFNEETKNLLATGYVVVVAADKQAGKATQIPKEIVEKMRPFAHRFYERQ